MLSFFGVGFEVVAFDTGQVKQTDVVDAPNRGGPPAFQKIAYLSKYTTWLDLAHIILASSKIRTSHPALALAQKIQSRS